MSNNEDSVSFSLTNFNSSEVYNPLYFKLRAKLSDRKVKTFSMNFTPYKIIGQPIKTFDQQTDDEDVSEDDKKLKLRYPSDIKIARQCNCVVIADDHNERILFLRLDNYELMTEFILEESVTDFWIESNGGNEFIYFGDHDKTYKFNIAQLINNSIVELKNLVPVWTISEKLSGSILLIYDSDRKEKILLRWNNSIQALGVYRDCDGSQLTSYPVNTLCDSPGLFEISNSEFIALNHESNEIFKITLSNGKCECSKPFQAEWKHPLSVAKELNHHRVYISDYGNKRIVVWDLLRECEITEHHDPKLAPFGIFYDDQSGLLYVVDQQACIVRVYQ